MVIYSFANNLKMDQTNVTDNYRYNVTTINGYELLHSIYLSLDSANTSSMVLIGLMVILVLILAIFVLKLSTFLHGRQIISDDAEFDERNLTRTLSDLIMSGRNSANNPDYGATNKPDPDSISQVSEMDISHGGVTHTSTANIDVRDAGTGQICQIADWPQFHKFIK